MNICRLASVAAFLIFGLLVAAKDKIAASSGSEMTVVPIDQPAPQQETGRAPTPSQKETSRISRLFMKDGSYEDIHQYEIKGDRVRFLSSDRHEWEEMPSSLVDWAATETYAREASAARRSRLNHLSEEVAKERAEAESSKPPVILGIALPIAGGVFLLDIFQGMPELNELHQNGADVKKNVAGNILRGVINPVGGKSQTIELAGPHALVQSHTAEPSIYVNIDSGGEPATQPAPGDAAARFRIVQCEEKKGNRIVGAVNIAVYGKVSGQTNALGIRAEPVGENWIKITPAGPLSSGEYALVEMLGDKGINTYVWDFGVNPAAPANPEARKSEPVKATEPPVLHQRKKP